MSNMYAIVLFLVITTTGSTLCVSNGDPEIFMVVDDQSTTTMQDSGMAMSKANPIEIGKFVLEDGKILTLSRKSSPSRNCIDIEQPCGAFHWCCEGLSCDGIIAGTCLPDPNCLSPGSQCALLTRPCCWPNICRGSTCIFGGRVW